MYALEQLQGDRFFTADYTPYNLTSWGFADCQRDFQGPGFGSMLGRLLLRTLPNNYSDNSVYTWFPLMTPDSMETNLHNLKKLNEYTLERPANRAPIHTVTTHGDIVRVLEDSEAFSSPYAERAQKIVKGPGFFISEPGVPSAQQEQKDVVSAIAPSHTVADKIGTFFHDTVVKLVKEHSYALVDSSTMNVDIVRDVLKYAPLHWAATEIVSGLDIIGGSGSDG
jgi:linoleate 10R-lipoxygenase